MVIVLYATYLYSSPDRRPAPMPLDSPIEDRRKLMDEERGVRDDDQTSELQDLSQEKSG